MFKPERCVLCGDCLVNCPFNEYTREAAVAERVAIMEGEWAPILHQCAACHACNEVCPQKANPFDLISELQSAYGEVTLPALSVERIQRIDSERPRVLASSPPEEVETVLATCTAGELTPEVFDSLLYTGLPKLIGPAYYCCSALESQGNESGERERAAGFVAALGRYQPREVVCYHDGCYHVLASRVPEYGIEATFRPVHLFEHLLRVLHQHRDRISPLDMKVAYQRPCTSRSTPWKESLLDDLLELVGCVRVERRYDRGNALCCGSSLAARGEKRRARDAALRNIKDCQEHGAEALIYLCPGCGRNYREICEEWSLPLYQVSELCQMAIGERRQESYPRLPTLPA